MNTDLAVIEDTGLAVNREPEAVLEEAHRAAAALKRVIDSKPNKVMFGGHQYLAFEDWQTVGRFYGIAPRIVVTRPLTIGEVSGWEASAEAVHVPTGRVVASADAMCMDDEEKWRARPKYEWLCVTKTMGLVADPPKHELIWEKGSDGKSRPKKERVLAGEERVPSFQLRSMAQTRAGAKALRNALAWVVVLAGYQPTPAEELPTELEEAEEPLAPPLRKGPTAQAEQPPPPEEPAGEDGPMNETLERSLLLTRCKGAADKAGLKADKRAAILVQFGIRDPREASIDQLQAMLEHLRGLTLGA